MRYPWRKARINTIHIDGQIDGILELRDLQGIRVFHFQYLYTKFSCLLPQVCIEGSDAHLHQSGGMPSLHDPGKGTGM